MSTTFSILQNETPNGKITNGVYKNSMNASRDWPQIFSSPTARSFANRLRRTSCNNVNSPSPTSRNVKWQLTISLSPLAKRLRNWSSASVRSRKPVKARTPRFMRVSHTFNSKLASSARKRAACARHCDPPMSAVTGGNRNYATSLSLQA